MSDSMTATTLDRLAESPDRIRSRRRRRLRTVGLRLGTYGALGGFALFMVFPFIFMFFTSLKDAGDVFNFPPRLLPRAAETTTFDGSEAPLYAIEVDGATRRTVLVEEGIRAGLFIDPATATLTDETEAGAVVAPLDAAVATGDSVTIDGEVLELFSLDDGGQTSELALLRNTAVGRFVVEDDPDREAFAVVRTSEPVESFTARWNNYREVFDIREFDRSLTNTILVTIFVVAGQLFTSIMGGYAFARIRFPGRDALFVAYLGSIMIPFVVLIIPLFQIMVQLGWNNHLGSLVFPFIFTAYGTFLMRQFFVQIPGELEEAALIDGASRWTILWRLYVPLSMPAIATLAAFSFLYAWNSFIWPLVAIDAGNTDDQVVTLALQVLGGQGADAPQLIFAGVTLAMTFPMLIFVFAQKYFVENVATSGIK